MANMLNPYPPLVFQNFLHGMQRGSRSPRSQKDQVHPNNFWTYELKSVYVVNKKSTVNVRFSNVLLSWYKSKWWKKFKSNTKPNFKYCISLSIYDPDIQPGVFLNKMRGRVQYGRPNLGWANKSNNQCLFLFAVILWTIKLIFLVCRK